MFPFCWRKVAGHTERTFVRTTRAFVCQYHADKLMQEYKENSWSGSDWSKQEFIPLTPTPTKQPENN